MPLTLYTDRDGFLHRLHPGVKIGGMVAVFAAAFATEQPLFMLPLTLGLAALIHVAGAWGNVRRMRVLFGLVFLMTFVVWALFFRGGVPWLQFGPLAVSPTSLRFGLGMALKLLTFLAAGTLFLSTTKIEEVAYALTRLGVPYKLGFTMTLAFRLVPVFLDSALTVVQAQRCRGFDFESGGLLQRVRRYVPVLVPVFIGALRRADGMAMALEARGFQSRRQRTVFEPHRFRAADAAVSLLSVAIVGLYAALWSRGYLTVPIP